MRILTVAHRKDENFLREKTSLCDLAKYPKKEIRELIKEMRLIMKKSDGVGLSANQIGLGTRLFIAEIPDGKGKNKFYAIANPEIIKTQGNMLELEEGCLSVPGKYGKVKRFEKVVLSGADLDGKSLKIKAWGLLAHIFQHEVDHLNGILFIDKTREVYDAPKSEKLKEKHK